MLVYAISSNSPPETVFLSTANFTNSPTGGAMDPAHPMSENRGFVVFHKAGDGVILSTNQVGPGYSNTIGAYAPLCR
ncbi:hypothetical protein BH09VER1_BH09VER1_44600 [soil metagenome]